MKQKNPATREDIENQISEILSSMALNKNLEDHIKRVPYRYRLQYAKCLSSPTKRALSVKMKCYECVGFESVSTRISECTCRLCPLWLHRPFQDKIKNDSDEIETGHDE